MAPGLGEKTRINIGIVPLIGVVTFLVTLTGAGYRINDKVEEHERAITIQASEYSLERDRRIDLERRFALLEQRLGIFERELDKANTKLDKLIDRLDRRGDVRQARGQQ